MPKWNPAGHLAGHDLTQLKQEAKRLRAINQKLLEALEGLDKTMREQLSALVDAQKIDANETRAAFEKAREAIEEARK